MRSQNDLQIIMDSLEFHIESRYMYFYISTPVEYSFNLYSLMWLFNFRMMTMAKRHDSKTKAIYIQIIARSYRYYDSVYSSTPVKPFDTPLFPAEPFLN